jgi:hypothetical protein
MIRVALFQSDTRVGEVVFFELPLNGEDSYRCDPEGACCSSCVWKIADALQHGHMHGSTCRHVWYRQAGGSLTPQADAAMALT